MGKYFCPLPSIGISIRADGSFSPCFLSRLPKTTVDPRRESLTEAFRVAAFANLREKFKNDEQPIECQRCWKAESQGQISYRQKALAQFGNLVTETPIVRVADFGFGNGCQGACIACGNTSSSQWFEDAKYLESEAPDVFQRSTVGHVRYTMDAWSDEELRNLKVLCLFQSESLIQPEFKAFLERLRKLNHLSSVKLEISTNAALFPDESLLALLFDAESLDLQISVDAIGAQFEYLRHPLAWSSVVENTKKWLYLFQNSRNFSIRAHFTYNLLNVFEFPKVEAWWEELAADCGVTAKVRVSTGQVSDPEYLRPELLKGLPTLNSLPPYAQSLILNGSLTAQKVAELRKTTLRYLELLDLKRHRDFTSLFPAIAEELACSPRSF